jgi:hypothetical protein
MEVKSFAWQWQILNLTLAGAQHPHRERTNAPAGFVLCTNDVDFIRPFEVTGRQAFCLQCLSCLLK